MAGPPGSPRNSIAPKPSIVTSRPVRPSARLANSGMTHLRWSNAFKSSAASKRLGATSAQGGSGKRTGITDIVLIRGASVHQSLTDILRLTTLRNQDGVTSFDRDYIAYTEQHDQMVACARHHSVATNIQHLTT